MGEILSHAEVEAILSAIEPSRPIPRENSTGRVPEAGAWERHDFRRPDAMQGAALKVVHALHQGICQRWQARIEGLLQSHVQVQPVGACQSTAAEFFKAASSQYLTCQVTHSSSAAESLLVWSSELVQMLIARMLGGSDGEATQSTDHAMTNIELRLLARLNDAVLGELGTLLGDSLTVADVAQNVAAIPERATTFPCIWFSFEVVGSGIRGLMHLGIPGLSLPLSGNGADATRHLPLQAIPTGIQRVSVQVSASLASLKLKAADLAAMQVGDIVMTDKSPSETVSLQLDGRSLCHATIGMHLGRKALRLTTDPGG